VGTRLRELLLRFEGRELVERLLQGGGLELNAQALRIREHGLCLGHDEVAEATAAAEISASWGFARGPVVVPVEAPRETFAASQ